MPRVRIAFAAAVLAACVACDGMDRSPAPAPSPVGPDQAGAPPANPGAAAPAPQQPAPAPSARTAAQGPGERQVVMMDACDPETFNATIGPGTCNRSGGVTFQTFIDQLTRHGVAAAWRFAPWTTTVKSGVTFAAVNRGGEVHTFTEVSQFGGGIVADLNQLSGLPNVAPECTSLAQGDFVPPGGTVRDVVDGTGTVRYQCCIHPWMQLQARVSQ